MTVWAKIPLQGWGRNARAQSLAARPERMHEALAAARDRHDGQSLIAFGAGRSYGDCGLNSAGRTLITARLDRVLGFDRDSGIIQVEPGVTLRRLLQDFLPRGFAAPVSPGTGFATIGGAVANDVHGKNHEHAGSFGTHVTELDLLLPSGVQRTITPQSDPALFAATIGGIGLTGILTRIAFRMVRVQGSDVRVRTTRVPDLNAFLARLADAQTATYSVGWIDATARGAALGRGSVETAEPIASSAARAPKRGPTVPIDFPGLALNPISIKAFNELYFRRVPDTPREQAVHLGRFLYPLDAITGWNRIYGKRGFHQFQCVVPFANGETSLRALMEIVTGSGQASFLAVLKRLGAGSGGYLSFPEPGYTLALDFPHFAGIADLHHRLVACTRTHGGRVYLAKDSLLTAEEFQGMYPDLPALRDVLADIDPAGRMASDMSRRLRISR